MEQPDSCKRTGMSLAQLFDACAGLGFVRQRAVQQQLPNHSWALDPQRAALVFRPKDSSGETRSSSIQIIGSSAKENGSWLWGWANRGSGFPPEALEAAEALRQVGEQSSIAELTTPALRLDERVNPHILGLVAVAVLDASGYFVCSAPHGDLLVLLDESFRTQLDRSAGRVALDFPMILAAGYPIIDPREVYAGYLEALGLEITAETDAEITAVDEEDREVIATFSGDRIELNAPITR
jgi:hypothetical protein